MIISLLTKKISKHVFFIIKHKYKTEHEFNREIATLLTELTVRSGGDNDYN